MDAAQTQFFAQWQASSTRSDDAAPSTPTGAMSQGGRHRNDLCRWSSDRSEGTRQPMPVKQLDYHFNADSKGYFASQGWESSCANGKLDETLTVVVGFNFKSPLLQGASPDEQCLRT